MNDLLVIFESKYGQTEKIARFTGELARRRGLDARVVHVAAARTLDIDALAAAVVVAPIYFGEHPRTIERFLRVRADALSARPFAFVSVSNSAANPDQAVRAQAVRLAERFIDDLGLRPEALLTAAGALAYPRYNLLLRFVMKRIARRTSAPLDTSRLHELTDFVALEHALAPFLETLEPRSKTTESPDVRPTTGAGAASALRRSLCAASPEPAR